MEYEIGKKLDEIIQLLQIIAQQNDVTIKTLKGDNRDQINQDEDENEGNPFKQRM